ncbi:hypothetical protein GCM10008014_56330 [Paenibacillus silvae]|uniref:Uncharacterized protein n=1 Tax=Paenibacillus silvae TaxID=1325358 RepID=A0ABQ1ZPP8_9BACL|nr:hypothetical protein GCM10008014_56330 [Paenibacillus silvae]
MGNRIHANDGEHRLPVVIFGTDTYRGGSEYIYFIERKHYENV